MTELKLPKMLSGNKLIDALRVLPEYDLSIIDSDMSERLIGLSNLYKIYIPSEMSVEIYNKLYMATMMSFQKKQCTMAVKQQGINFKAMQDGEYHGIIGGSDSFSIIGTSGIGKSSAIERAIQLISGNSVIVTAHPYAKVIPCLVVQCPFDCSSKGMLLEILRKVDEHLGTKYYECSRRTGVTVDVLIGTVAQVSINHIGVLVIDEIQHVAGHKSGMSLVRMLTQLINSSGISICMVGTPESVPFFEQAMQLARRTMGLSYGPLFCEGYFRDACRVILRYQYVKKPAEITDAMIDWLYEHSAGVISVVISLIHDAQEMAIFDGTEGLDIAALNTAYVKRLSLLHSYIAGEANIISRTPKKQTSVSAKEVTVTTQMESIFDVVEKAKESGTDVVKKLRGQVQIEEVSI